MNTRLIFTALSLITTAAFAADLSPVPAESIARKKELLFSDDFESATPAKPWHRVVDTFAFEKGALKGMQTRDKNVPATDGKPAITAGTQTAVDGQNASPTFGGIVSPVADLDACAKTGVQIQWNPATSFGSPTGSSKNSGLTQPRSSARPP